MPFSISKYIQSLAKNMVVYYYTMFLFVQLNESSSSVSIFIGWANKKTTQKLLITLLMHNYVLTKVQYKTIQQ